MNFSEIYRSNTLLYFDLKGYSMNAPDVFALRHSDLNPFLFADVGIERNGMTLSVVSVFARLGSDPWREAGRLAGLPVAAAADSLARTIAAMPESVWSQADARTIAARLVALLPAHPRPTSAGAPAPSLRGYSIWVVGGLLLAACLSGLFNLLF
ncbi:hypothetical protein [Limobrevibacterium gyesilva]|uniref:Uncharacterized protein n=1 Tax=Limobrevibacterium gyesilva TaxID=2991712 RepID=A0AA41YM27_9PROT|nr:hypothetical protein [Limobrevibacterium gyesilva]MCW3474986.1 hypothetical protein [Limobrevibacterium gyesilva]